MKSVGAVCAFSSKDPFTMYCYANIGVPRNIENPTTSKPTRNFQSPWYNSLGTKYVNYGLGSGARWLDFTRMFRATSPEFRELFKTPSMRGADKRPWPDFAKAYMTAVFKSLPIRLLSYYRDLSAYRLIPQCSFHSRRMPHSEWLDSRIGRILGVQHRHSILSKGA
jgi:hypothetical protein